MYVVRILLCVDIRGKSVEFKRYGVLLYLLNNKLKHLGVGATLLKVACWALALSTGAVFLTGCSVNVRSRPRPLVQHNQIQGELDLVAERRTDEQGTSANKRESTTKVFEERLRLKTDGDVYHPDFLLFNAAVGLGLAQQSLHSDDESGRHSESLNDYSVFTQLLRGKPYPTTFYATKSEELISRQFLGALRTERESQGASMTLRNKEWPMTFQYINSQANQEQQ